jgi:hypothetical protein
MDKQITKDRKVKQIMIRRRCDWEGKSQ